jgi:hypothetical protein
MATTLPMANLSRETLRSRLRCYYTLTKPEVNLLILMTTSAGYYLAESSDSSIRSSVLFLSPAAPQPSISGWSARGTLRCAALLRVRFPRAVLRRGKH